jgi:hypothetical protein
MPKVLAAGLGREKLESSHLSCGTGKLIHESSKWFIVYLGSLSCTLYGLPSSSLWRDIHNVILGVAIK